jgi:hypothetical protein
MKITPHILRCWVDHTIQAWWEPTEGGTDGWFVLRSIKEDAGGLSCIVLRLSPEECAQLAMILQEK